MMNPQLLRTLTLAVLALLMAAYAAIWTLAPMDISAMARIWWCAPVGAFGALIANSTGAGGGLVFIPVFHVLGTEGILPIVPEGVVGASFLIQCFGMSVGALTWFNRLYGSNSGQELDLPRSAKLRVMALVLTAAAPAMLVAQHTLTLSPATVLIYFKGVSIALGLALLATTLAGIGAKACRTDLARLDAFVLVPLAIVSGVATALFSIGVGEFVALYLLMRGYPMRATVASAVIISAVMVLIGAPYHIANSPIPWEVVALAAPGVAVGGFLARRLAYWLGEKRLKIGASLWIIGSSLYLILR